MSESTQPDRSSRAGRPPGRVLALAAFIGASLLALAVGVGAGWIDGHTIERLIAEPGPDAMVAYVALVFLLELLWCPRMWGLLAGGLIFGPWRGAALSLVADLLSACFCFAMARRGGRAWVAERLGSRPRARAIVRLLAHRRGMVTVALLRVLPFHYTAVSYAAGVAGVTWAQFLLGTLGGALPGAVLYNAVGDAARRPTSPVFIGGVLVLIALGVVGALWARRLWRGRQSLLSADGELAATVSEPSGSEGCRATVRRGSGAEGN